MKVMDKNELESKIIKDYTRCLDIQNQMFKDIVDVIEADLFLKEDMSLFDLTSGDSSNPSHKLAKDYVYDKYFDGIIDRYLFICYGKAEYDDFLDELTDYLV